MAVIQFPFGPVAGHWRRRQKIRSSVDRQALFDRIAPVYDNVIGLDFSREQLMVASSRQQSRSNPCYRNLKWMEGDAVDLPFPDCHFDAITMGYGLRNVIDKYKAMKEVHRVLKPGSKASILDLNKSTDEFRTSFQGLIIDNLIVPVAASYGLSEEYQYLKRSIQEFLTGEELEHLALEAGFSSAKHFEVGGGLMGNLVASR
ncbi:2-phytyl-1,4-beta-naphthoquinone methyltransferase, chloroplastic isoform X2 [Cynara cardunculus var. scolymus]|nr:2-phytyl-1,4-beta-naphthoquinone methyltransferase, chloroplastic isoform X2 [Cynara cardunculus var. scolymus]